MGYEGRKKEKYIREWLTYISTQLKLPVTERISRSPLRFMKPVISEIAGLHGYEDTRLRHKEVVVPNKLLNPLYETPDGSPVSFDIYYLSAWYLSMRGYLIPNDLIDPQARVIIDFNEYYWKFVPRELTWREKAAQLATKFIGSN